MAKNRKPKLLIQALNYEENTVFILIICQRMIDIKYSLILLLKPGTFLFLKKQVLLLSIFW